MEKLSALGNWLPQIRFLEERLGPESAELPVWFMGKASQSITSQSRGPSMGLRNPVTLDRLRYLKRHMGSLRMHLPDELEVPSLSPSAVGL